MPSLRARVNKLAHKEIISYEDARRIREALLYRTKKEVVVFKGKVFCPTCKKEITASNYCKECGQALIGGSRNDRPN